MDSKFILMGGCLREIGWRIKSMELEHLIGQMAGNIMECIKMMKRKDLGFLSGLMEGNMRENG